MESGGKNYDLHREVNAWLTVAGENLCDRATAELRKRVLASVETECQRLENEGLSRELAVKQAISNLGNPTLAKPGLETKHLTKREYISVGNFFLPPVRAFDFSWKLLLVPLFVFGLPLLLLVTLASERDQSFKVAGLLLASSLFALFLGTCNYLIQRLHEIRPASNGKSFSKQIWNQWIMLAFFLNLPTLNVLMTMIIRHDDPEGFYLRMTTVLLANVMVIGLYRPMSRLSRKIEALENDGFEYVLLPGAATHRG